MLKPYAAGGRGAVLLSSEPLVGLLAALRKANYNAHVHAIGDRTLRVVLDAVQTAKAASPRGFAGHRCPQECHLGATTPLGCVDK